MQRINSIKDTREAISLVKAAGKTIGFVPTMGHLHEGHLSLIDYAQSQCDFVVVSIYVNPTQFGISEDFEGYPRDLEKDIELCENKGVNLVFCPENEEMFPKDYSTYVNEEDYSSVLCGISRPTHFRGVTTVCTKLFNIVQADFAFFGQKDAQQAAVIRKLCIDLNINVEIVTCPIVREPDGLAMSSRNTYLDAHKRDHALTIYRSLLEGKKLFEKGFTSSDRIVAEIIHQLSTSRTVRIIYAEVVNKNTMKKMSQIVPGESVLCVSAWVDQVRLIDNMEF